MRVDPATQLWDYTAQLRGDPDLGTYRMRFPVSSRPWLSLRQLAQRPAGRPPQGS